jgi:hypothetical protein
MLHDFAENSFCIFQGAAQGHHWNNAQTIHSITYHEKRISAAVTTENLKIISHCLKRDIMQLNCKHFLIPT